VIFLMSMLFSCGVMVGGGVEGVGGGLGSDGTEYFV
jgi:hypothetical protein